MNNSKQFQQSDCWAFGIVMCELFSYGETPYPKLTNEEVMEFVCNKGITDFPETMTSEVKDLVAQCLSFSPEKRPPFGTIFQVLKNLYSSPNTSQ